MPKTTPARTTLLPLPTDTLLTLVSGEILPASVRPHSYRNFPKNFEAWQIYTTLLLYCPFCWRTPTQCECCRVHHLSGQTILSAGNAPARARSVLRGLGNISDAERGYFLLH